MFQYKRKNGYWYIGLIENGKRRNVSCKTKNKALANEFYRNFKAELHGNKDMRISDLEKKALFYISGSVGDKMYAQYVSTLSCFKLVLGNERLSTITKTDIEKYLTCRENSLSSRGKPFSKYSLNLEIAVLKRVFDIAVDKDWVIKDPTKRIKKYPVKSTTEAFEENELQQFLAEVKENTKNIHYYYAIVIALLTGMRKGEIASLTWSQIDDRNMKIHLQNKITGEPECAFYNETVTEIFNILRESKIKSSQGYVWGKHLNVRNLNRTFNHWRDKLGLSKRLHFHSTRHTAITGWANNLNLHIAQDLSRHADPRTTKGYIKVREKQLKNAISQGSISIIL